MVKFITLYSFLIKRISIQVESFLMISGWKQGIYQINRLGYMNYYNNVIHGPYKRLHSNGKIYSVKLYKHGKQYSTNKEWFDNGSFQLISTYNNLGNLNGPFISYFDNGNIYIMKNYKNGILHGMFIKFNYDKSISDMRFYNT